MKKGGLTTAFCGQGKDCHFLSFSVIFLWAKTVKWILLTERKSGKFSRGPFWRMVFSRSADFLPAMPCLAVRKTLMWATKGMMYTVKVTSMAPTVWVDGSKEWECYSKEPDRQNHRHAADCTKKHVFCSVDTNKLLLYKVKGCHSKSHCDELQTTNNPITGIFLVRMSITEKEKSLFFEPW